MQSSNSLFLAKGQIRKSEFSQDLLDAYNRENGYRTSGVRQRGDWEKAKIASKVLFQLEDDSMTPRFVTYNGDKYVLKDGIEVVE